MLPHHTSMRKLFIALLVVCLLITAGFAAYRGYGIWRQDHGLKLAREFIAKSDYNNAVLSLRSVLRANPSNLDAVRMMGDFAEVLRNPIAMHWRRQLVELEPGSLTNRLLLARLAMSSGDLEEAAKALDGVADKDRDNAQYHKAAGAVAIATGHFVDAELHFSRAAELEPSNPVAQMNLAVIELQKEDPAVANKGRQSLEMFRTNPAVRVEALRNLARDSLRRKDTNAALALTRELLAETNSMFADRLLHLSILHNASVPELPAALADTQADASTHPGKAFDLGKWIFANHSPAQALAWLQSLPGPILTNPPVPLLVADCYVATRDWPNLQKLTEQQQWGDLEFLRLFHRTRALREQSMDAAAKSEWARTVKATERKQAHLVKLFQLVSTCRWPAEELELLWALVNRFPSEKWAFQALGQRLHSAGQTRQLLSLYQRAAETDPSNLESKNNLAMVALLLNAGDKRPHELAKEIHDKAPANPFYTSTYALSLHLQGKSADGLRVLESLDPKQLQEPSLAAYYAFFLQTTGNTEKAKEYRDLAAKARLLPEERALLFNSKS